MADDNPVREIPIDTDEVVAKVSEEVKDKVITEISDKVSSDVSEKVTASVVESITDKLGGKKEEKWIPKDYEEIKETTKQEMRKEWEEREAKAREDQKKADDTKAQEQVKRQEQWEQAWNTQIETLTKDNHIPAPSEEIQAKLSKKEKLSKEDLEDEGLSARRELYRLADEHKEYDLEKVYYKYILPKKNEVPRGAYAPVSGSSKTTTPEDKGGYSYEDIHGAKGFEDLLPK